MPRHRGRATFPTAARVAALYKIGGGLKPPSPKVVSCVTGSASYDALNARDTLIRWVDHPQLLWDAITETLVGDVDLVIHAGPAPNLIPATFDRLSNNVTKQLGNKYLQMIGRGVGSSMNRHAWLLRLSYLEGHVASFHRDVQHVILEAGSSNSRLIRDVYSVYNECQSWDGSGGDAAEEDGRILARFMVAWV